MKTRVILLMASVAATACSSTDAGTPAGSAGAGNAGAANGGSGTMTGAAGTLNGASGAAAGGGGNLGSAGASGSAGAPGSAGAASGLAGAGGAAGSSTAGGAGGGGAPASAGAAGAAGAVNVPNQVPPGYTGTPFGGTPQTIPGKIEIERYDLGGLNVAFSAMAVGAFNKCQFMRADGLNLHCTGEGQPTDLTATSCATEPPGQVYLGYINVGDWYKYTVNVLEAGTYVISGHEGIGANNGAQVQFTFTDATKTGSVTLPSTAGCGGHEAYHVWATQDNLGEIALQPGKYALTITIVGAGMNLDWFAFTKK